MSANSNSLSSQFFRIVIMLFLVLGYVGVSVYFRLVLSTSVVYTHFAYIPIVIAGMWWGKKAIVISCIFAGKILLFHLLSLHTGDLLADLARILFFIIVALCVGTLSEKVFIGQKALRVSEEKYRFLVDKSLAGILLYQDDIILFANERFAEMLGYRTVELLGMTIWDLFYELDKPKIKQLVLKRKLEGFEDLHYESRLIRKNGKTIWADVASSIEHYEGESAVLVNAYNITEKKEAERKRKELQDLTRKQEEQLVHSTRLAELGEMAAAIAHELNQPLTGIRNFAKNAAYMIEQNAGSIEEVRGNLQLISGQVDRAAKIINRMRELARKSDRKFTLFDINNILRETTEFLMPQFRLSGVEVNLTIANDLPEILGDKTRMEQVFLNILTNARQAMEGSKIRRIGIQTFLDMEKELPVIVEITDTGKGLSDAEAQKIFMPFYTTKEPGQGTGLGLSITLTIVKEHNGTIEASGFPGKGAKFTLRLPIPKEQNASEDSIKNE